jgi:hypothetical protein
MEGLFKILFNALPEALGALIAAGIITLLSYIFVKRLRKASHPTELQHLPLEPAKPEIYSNLPPRTDFIGREKEKVLIIEEKKKILMLLAHLGVYESYQILKKYNNKPDKELFFWAKMALDE